MGGLNSTVFQLARRSRLRQFAKFCVVGVSGLAVDMALLHLLADPRCAGWNVSFSKACSAETAMLSNFFLNEVWTFRGFGSGAGARWPVAVRLVKFQLICGVGIGFAVLLLNLFYRKLHLNLYVANLLAIVLVTAWNFLMNACFNWGGQGKKPGVGSPHPSEVAANG
jgi:dolichol-phosphate mannosyltransferase